MLPDTPAIEFVGHTGKLNFTVKGLIRDAEQSAVRDAEAEPLAAIAADSMSSAIARDCDRRRMMAGSPISQLRLSTLATVPVRITCFSSKPSSPVTSPTANS